MHTKKNVLTFAIGLFLFLATSCSQSNSGSLFDGSNINKWNISEGVTAEDNILSLKGTESQAILKNGKYKNFDLTMEVKTQPGAKGSVYFHTDQSLNKGYRVAINNDRTDPVWWKMTGSLESVRNLTKSFVKENEWFTMNIRVDGKKISVSVDNEPVVDYIEPTAPYRINSNVQTVLSEGTFAIVNHSPGGIQVRNVVVNVLEPKTESELTAQLAEAIDEQNDDIIKLHQENFPVLDYHVHLKGGLTKEVAARQSRKVGINYAIAPNCGIGFPITDDQEIYAYLDSMRTQPFILAMQAEGREWLKTFSPEARNEFDYVFTDALTFTDNKGRRTRLWIPEETWIENEEQYMDLIVDRICMVLQEPVDIYVNPCFLPEPMNQRYDELWTEARMNKFIDALKKSGKALEINDVYQIPNKAILLKAKEAGIKFTFGTNNVKPEVGQLKYCIRMKKECGLTAQDMYRPKIKI